MTLHNNILGWPDPIMAPWNQRLCDMSRFNGLDLDNNVSYQIMMEKKCGVVSAMELGCVFGVMTSFVPRSKADSNEGLFPLVSQRVCH